MYATVNSVSSFNFDSNFKELLFDYNLCWSTNSVASYIKALPLQNRSKELFYLPTDSKHFTLCYIKHAILETINICWPYCRYHTLKFNRPIAARNRDIGHGGKHDFTF